MLKPVILLSGSALFIGVLSGCNKSANVAVVTPEKPVKQVEVNAQNEKTLFPIAEGNSWIFSMETKRELAGRPADQNPPPQTSEVEYKVAKVVDEGKGVYRAIFDLYKDGEKRDEQEWISEDFGYSLLSMSKNRIAYTPRQPIIRYPVTIDREYDWEGTGATPTGAKGSMKYHYKYNGLQDVDTEMGAISGMMLESVGSFKNDDGGEGTIANNSWFAPGIGLIRYKQVVGVKEGRSSITLRLKSYNVK
jgi:hypothetical protein